ATVYVHLIPPGAADTAHFRMHIPENAGPKITLRAKLNYRKFMWWNTQFAFMGKELGQPSEVSPDYDDRKWVFRDIDSKNISGELKEVPNLPTITVAEDSKTLNVLARNAGAPEAQVALAKEDWVRWNDYGIGLFLQGDLRGAAVAFQNCADIDPNNPDGWVNIGRTLLQEGDTGGT